VIAGVRRRKGNMELPAPTEPSLLAIAFESSAR
jgi:hypothetical protein